MPVPSGSRVFDGVNDWLQTAAPLDLSSYSTITVLCRFWWDTFANDNAILMELTPIWTSNPGNFVIWPNHDGGSFGAGMFESATGYQFRRMTRPTADAWHELAVIFDRPAANTLETTFYLDGVNVPGTLTDGANTTGNFGNAVLYFMSRAGTHFYAGGKLSDVAIYGSALTAPQILQYSEGRAGSVFGSPIAYWPLAGTGSTELDASGHGHHLTVSGATAGDAPLPTLGTDPIITIGGVTRTASTRVYNEAVSIRDVLDHVPNTCELTVDGTEPPIGADVKIGLGGVSTLAQLLFAGHVRQVRQVYEGQKAENVAWHVSCIDYTWLLNRRKVITQYQSQSATTTILHLITNYTSGFTSTHVAAGLATLDPITFTNEEPADCLTRICKLLGAYWYVDYLKDVHVFLTEATDTPANITDANPQGAAAIESVEDLSQIRTRVYVEGGGSVAAQEIAVGSTVLYVDDASWYNASGGTVVAGAQRITYTGKSTEVISPGTPIAAPTTAPTVSIPSGNGNLAGTYRYKYTRQTDLGETTGSSASASVSPAGPGTPTAPSASENPANGLLAGSYLYKISYVTPLGETLPGTASSAVTPDAWPSPTAPVAAELNENGPLAGSYFYRITFVTALGETLPGATHVSAATPDAWPTPTAFGFAPAELADPGPLIGTYLYKASYVTALGETLLGAANAAVTPDAWPTAGAPTVAELAESGPLSGSYLYKVSFVTAVGETLPGTASAAVTPDAQAAPGAIATTESVATVYSLYGGSYSWATTFVNAFGETTKGTTTTRTPTTSPAPGAFNSALGGTGGGLTAGGSYAYTTTFVSAFGETTAGTVNGPFTLTAPNTVVSLSLIDVGPVGTIARRIYRTVNGGSEYRYAGEIPNNTATSYNDFIGDLGLGERIPDRNTFGGYAVTVTGIDTGPTGTTARHVYRTKQGGSTYYLVGVIADNTTTTFVDDVPDSALTINEPSASTAAGEKVRLTAIPTGVTGTLARRIYRTKAGGSSYYYLDELSNNTTTTFDDAIPDEALTRAAPLVSTAQGEQVHLAGIPAGPTGTIARKLYRTKAGGSAYFYLDELSDNTTTVYDDAIPDAQLTIAAPSVSTAGGEKVRLTSIDTGVSGTLARRIYRTKAGGSSYYYLDELSNNTTTTYDDEIPDSALTRGAPLVSTAGGEQVDLSFIPTAAASSGVTARRIYRTKAGGSEYFYVDQLSNNTTTTYTDNVPDAQLTSHPPLANTAGGQTVLVSAVLAGPAGTIARKLYRTKAGGGSYFYLDTLEDNTTTIYTDNKTDAQLGALLPTANTTGGTAETLNTLTGIPPSGAGSVLYMIPKGEPVNILLTRNDSAAQTALAALVGGDGIQEHYIQDNRLAEAECIARGDAELAAFKSPIVTITFTTRDPNATAGKAITFSLGAPTNLSGTFKIQDVTISQVGQLPGVLPLRTVTASSQRFSLEELFRLRRGVGSWAA